MKSKKTHKRFLVRENLQKIITKHFLKKLALGATNTVDNKNFRNQVTEKWQWLNRDNQYG